MSTTRMSELFKAVMANDSLKIQKLLSHTRWAAIIHDLDPPMVGHTLLTFAAKHGKVEAVRFLTEHGVSVNQVNAKGESALIAAAKARCFPMVDWLKKQPDIDLSIKDNDGKTADHYINPQVVAETTNTGTSGLGVQTEKVLDEVAEAMNDFDTVESAVKALSRLYKP
jgi:ankyrin repeat protein